MGQCVCVNKTFIFTFGTKMMKYVAMATHCHTNGFGGNVYGVVKE